jgi:hypothetical protein
MEMPLDSCGIRLQDRLLTPVEPILANRARCCGLLLCECTERPSGRTAEESVELASVHCITSADEWYRRNSFALT